MNGFEYAMGLISVLIGLALVDVAMSVHKLVRHCMTVRWDARVILSASLVVLIIVRMWFALWSIRDVAIVLYFPFYLSLFVEFMLLFLLASSCLPDEPPADCNLGQFYESNQRTLWTVFAVFQLSFYLHWLYFGGTDAPCRPMRPCWGRSPSICRSSFFAPAPCTLLCRRC
jgi:hypothetical protein